MNPMLQDAVARALREIGVDDEVPQFELPRQPGHGDVTTTVAMVLGRKLKRNPRQLAQEIISRMQFDSTVVSRVETAGPGFINFTFTTEYYHRSLREMLDEGDSYGRSSTGEGKRVQVEFVSANPTGPLTVGHGRGAVYGDAVARLLEWTGHEVEREYYFNDAGRQMRILGDSVRLRYLEELGEPVTFPEDYYQGEYIRDIARLLKESRGHALRDEPAEGIFKETAEREIFEDIKETLKSLGIVFDSFFNEHSLYADGKIDEVVKTLRARDLVYEQDGATWFRTSALGAEKDKVIIKSTGEPTYRLPDIAYHREKFVRGYDMMIDVFGADHIATYPDVLAGVTALGYDASKVKVLIHQFVTIVQGGEVVKMSTRKANFVTLDELVAETGADVVRFFFLMRTVTSHLNFDIGLAKQQTDENPVYYLQYAHARICSILRVAGERGVSDEGADTGRLTAPEEMDLIKLLLRFPDTVESCAATHEPHRLADYLLDVARTFHGFYQVHRVVGDDPVVSAARLALCHATRIVLRNGLRVLGIGAPEKM